MRILAIETSCDETGIALLEAGGGLKNPCFKILKNLVASQVKIHQPFGGVVPNLAKREHLRNLPRLFDKLVCSSLAPNSKCKNQNVQLRFKIKKLNVDLIAVTVGPGLEPALWSGIEFARDLHRELTVRNRRRTTEIIGVNHLLGHLYSFLLSSGFKIRGLKPKTLFPAVALIISGGHTILLLVKGLTDYKKLGETRDDAAGEAFDKAARLLNLHYPGGPALEKLAREGDSRAVDFPRPMLNQKNYDFSFSGLKTAVLYYLRDNPSKTKSRKSKADIAASFQEAAADVLVRKTLRAAREYGARTILVSGGVASNNFLRNYLKSGVKSQKLKIEVIIPEKKFCTDNAAVIAAAGYLGFLGGKKYNLKAEGDLNI